jgi:hypothetical protein
MATATLTFSASVEADGETKTIGSTATMTVAAIQTGKQTVGNAYEVVATNLPDNTMVILYNPSTVDVAVRMELTSYTTKRYAMYNIIAGGIFVTPRHYLTDTGTVLASRITQLAARTDSGTATVEYCIIN